MYLETKMPLIFKGYATRNIQEAIAEYRKKTGEEPTLILARPDFVVEGKHPNLIRSNFGASGILLVSHLATKEEITNRDFARGFTPIASKETLDEVDLVMRQPSIPKRKPGKPKNPEATCPHCKAKITDFNDLGFWWGWQFGIEPEYWEDLRLYVFRRDEFYCQDCHTQFGLSGLVCHHITPKEEGGTDSARNLTTLCKGCHQDDKPIFPNMEQD